MMETVSFSIETQIENFKIFAIDLAKHNFRRLNSVLGFQSQRALGEMRRKPFEREGGGRKEREKPRD